MVEFYLPVTSQPRELDAKLLLALVARERGHSASIGYKSVFQSRLGSLTPGIFITHNARQSTDRIRLTRDHGHLVFVLDEEALVRQTDEIFLKKHPQGAFDFVSRILCWGQDDFDMWEHNRIDAAGGKTIVGNPRFDLLRPEIAGFFSSQVASIKARFGDYLLLNTNFPTVNNLTPQGGGMRLSQWAMDQRGQELTDGFLANKRAILHAELALVGPLANAISPLTLVIRPHPNEDHAPWIAAARGIPNVHVMFEEGVVPWLLAATALVHNNCTTAVEAAAAGVPIVNFSPWKSDYDNQLSNAFGRTCRTLEEVVAALAEIRGQRATGLSQRDRALLRHHVLNTEGALSCEHIVAAGEAEAKTLDRMTVRRSGARRRAQARMQLLWLARFLKLYRRKSGRRKRVYLERTYPDLRIRKLDHEQLNYSKEQFDLLMRQFPPLDEAELNNKIRRFADVTGRFSSMRVEMLSQQLFRIA